MAKSDDKTDAKNDETTKPAKQAAAEKQAGDGKQPPEKEEAADKGPEPAPLVTPQAGQPVVAEDPRGDSPRKVAPSGFVTHGQAGVDHPNQAVQPTRYAEEMTRWLSLSEQERRDNPPPKPPEGCAPHPLAVHPDAGDDDGKDLGRKQVILK